MWWQAYNTVDNRRTTLKRIFESAVRNEIIRLNPLSDGRIKNTSVRKTATTCLSVEQVADILSNLPRLATLQQQLIIALYIFTGVRRQELLGLMWEDINLVSDTVHIQRAVVYYNGVLIKEPRPRKATDISPSAKNCMNFSYSMYGEPVTYFLKMAARLCHWSCTMRIWTISAAPSICMAHTAGSSAAHSPR